LEIKPHRSWSFRKGTESKKPEVDEKKLHVAHGCRRRTVDREQSLQKADKERTPLPVVSLRIKEIRDNP
jgi:hypothetical protein